MDEKSEKSFIKINIVICVINMFIIGAVSYFMKDMEWWKLMLSLFVILIGSALANTLNIVLHVKKK